MGDQYKSEAVINHGFVERKKVLKLLSISKYTIASGENLYSIFSIDCINHKVNILVNTNSNPEIIFFKNMFIYNNFKNQKINFKKIEYLKRYFRIIVQYCTTNNKNHKIKPKYSKTVFK